MSQQEIEKFQKQMEDLMIMAQEHPELGEALIGTVDKMILKFMEEDDKTNIYHT